MSLKKTYYFFFPFVFLYFFLNNFLLPQGLLYTSLLSPVFLYWLFKRKKLGSMVSWGLLLLIPVPFHLLSGVNLQSYLISSGMMITIWVFLFTAVEAVKKINENLQEMFSRVLLINSVLILAALAILPFGSLGKLMWDYTPISPGVQEFPRLMLLAYEPSHYALLLSPVFIYFILKLMTAQSGHPLLTALGVGIPLLLSLSFGVLGALFMALLIASIVYMKKLPASSRSFLFNLLILFVILLLVIAFVWPENPVFERIENIFAGEDTSAKGRLSDSFMFAVDLITQHNLIFGVGPGQVKILAHDFIVEYYQYYGEFAETVRIPNSMGEMMAVYGLYGFLLKLFFEIYFFVKLKVYNNLYSLSLFIFIFVYQFTGSFLSNAAEMGIWALAFASRLPDFEYSRLKKEER